MVHMCVWLQSSTSLRSTEDTKMQMYSYSAVLMMWLVLSTHIGRTQDSDSVDIQSLHVSRNKVVTLQCCTMSSGTMTFTIDGLYPHELPTSLKTDLMQFNDGQCHHVSFPANHINGSTEVLFIETADNLSTARCKYTVFILEPLGSPSNLSIHDINETHCILQWTSPDGQISYYKVEVEYFSDVNKTRTATVVLSSYTFLRYSFAVSFKVTAVNQAGDGEPTPVLDYTVPNDCKIMDTIGENLTILPYSKDNKISASIQLFEIHEKTCFDQIHIQIYPVDHEQSGPFLFEKILRPMIQDNKAVLILHQLPKQKHLKASLHIGSSNISKQFSTYSVQDVHIIYGKENTTIWCEFIAGSLNNTCHIFVLRGNSEFYNKTILKSTTLCLLKNDQVLIYDDVSQGSPTFSRIISLTTCATGEQNNNIVTIISSVFGCIGAGAVVIGVAIAAIVVKKCKKCKKKKATLESSDDGYGELQVSRQSLPTSPVNPVLISVNSNVFGNVPGANMVVARRSISTLPKTATSRNAASTLKSEQPEGAMHADANFTEPILPKVTDPIEGECEQQEPPSPTCNTSENPEPIDKDLRGKTEGIHAEPKDATQ